MLRQNATPEGTTMKIALYVAAAIDAALIAGSLAILYAALVVFSGAPLP